MTGRRDAWPGLASPPALTRRTPTKRPTLRLRGGRRTPLVAYAPSLSWAPWAPPEIRRQLVHLFVRLDASLSPTQRAHFKDRFADLRDDFLVVQKWLSCVWCG